MPLLVCPLLQHRASRVTSCKTHPAETVNSRASSCRSTVFKFLLCVLQFCHASTMTYSNIRTSIQPYKGINKNTIISIWSPCLNFAIHGVTCSLVDALLAIATDLIFFTVQCRFIPRHAFSSTTATPMLASWNLPLFSIPFSATA